VRVFDDLNVLHGDQPLAHHRVHMFKHSLDLFGRVDHLHHHGQVERQHLNIGGVDARLRSKTGDSAKDARPSHTLLMESFQQRSVQ